MAALAILWYEETSLLVDHQYRSPASEVAILRTNDGYWYSTTDRHIFKIDINMEVNNNDFDRLFDEMMSSIYYLHSQHAWQMEFAELYRAKISDHLPPTCKILGQPLYTILKTTA